MRIYSGSGGRDAVHINIGSNGENRVFLGRVAMNITLMIALLLNLILLHVVIVKIKNLSVAVNRIEEVEEKSDQILKSLHSGVYLNILLTVAFLFGHEVR